MSETLEIRRENVTGTSFRIGERTIITRGSNLVADFVHESDAQRFINGEAEIARLLELVESLTIQACSVDDHLDSCAISTYADAMRELERNGRIEITTDSGRRVIGKLKAEATNV